jgi:tetratricopeptide (TPR) repeat protein
MYCPECGHDAGDAKYCPECGVDLAGLKGALKGRTAGERGAGKGDEGRAAGGHGEPVAASAEKPSARGLSPAVIWGIFGALAVVAIIIIIVVSWGSGGGESATGTPSGNASAQPVQGVTTGSYGDLVQKGNAFYDKGDAAFQSQDFEQGSAYFQAAAMTYAAAWKKRHTDPSLGTDFATSLFYSGNIDAALKQIDVVIKAYPDFQPAWFNLGNYLSHKGAFAKRQGDQKAVQRSYAQAARAYTRAVALDPSSEVGKEADARLQKLPE